MCHCRFRRYVCEDRYTAIRWAIAAAQKGDVVVIAGKGDKDWTEVSNGADDYVRVCLLLFCWVLLSECICQTPMSGIWFSPPCQIDCALLLSVSCIHCQCQCHGDDARPGVDMQSSMLQLLLYSILT